MTPTNSEPEKTLIGILHPERQESFDNLINGIACHYERAGKGITDAHAADKYTLEYVYDQLLALIDKQVIEARKDELNRASYTIIRTLASDVDQEYDYADIQSIFENYQKLRAIELKDNLKGDE